MERAVEARRVGDVEGKCLGGCGQDKEGHPLPIVDRSFIIEASMNLGDRATAGYCRRHV